MHTTETLIFKRPDNGLWEPVAVFLGNEYFDNAHSIEGFMPVNEEKRKLFNIVEGGLEQAIIECSLLNNGEA